MTTSDVDVELVHLDDCPNWEQARARVREAMRRAGLDPARLRFRRVVTKDAPADFPGSPTILIRGRDAFPSEVVTGPTCRLYATPEGPSGIPSLEQLVDALTR